jgi:hypothetical protein
MVIFHSYVKLPEGMVYGLRHSTFRFENSMTHPWPILVEFVLSRSHWRQVTGSEEWECFLQTSTVNMIFPPLSTAWDPYCLGCGILIIWTFVQVQTLVLLSLLSKNYTSLWHGLIRLIYVDSMDFCLKWKLQYPNNRYSCMAGLYNVLHQNIVFLDKLH